MIFFLLTIKKKHNPLARVKSGRGEMLTTHTQLASKWRINEGMVWTGTVCTELKTANKLEHYAEWQLSLSSKYLAQQQEYYKCKQ